MSDRFLETLARAARSETEDHATDVTRTRAALLARAQGRVRLRRRASTAAVLLLLATFGGTALGSQLSRERVVAFWHAVVHRDLELRGPARRTEPHAAAGVAAVGAPGSASAGEKQRPPTRLEPLAPPPVPVSNVSTARLARPERSAPALVDPLYVEAHRAQFETEDAANALRLWNRYLEQSGRLEFVPEARYNRAICLVRLGRIQEAREALESFADGEFGAYRKREAGVLLERLKAHARER